jgi:isoquinoline 1-oxidoreductase subunit alpha
MQISVNRQLLAIDAAWQDESLLNVLREHLGLAGAKYGCGVGLCGACTILVDGVAQRSCALPIKTMLGKSITTIEGLARGERLHPVQQAWLDEAVPQCGYCQAGQIMSTVALLTVKPQPSAGDIDAALDGNLCRCGTQQRVRQAVLRAATALKVSS